MMQLGELELIKILGCVFKCCLNSQIKGNRVICEKNGLGATVLAIRVVNDKYVELS